MKDKTRNVIVCLKELQQHNAYRKNRSPVNTSKLMKHLVHLYSHAHTKQETNITNPKVQAISLVYVKCICMNFHIGSFNTLLKQTESGTRDKLET